MDPKAEEVFFVRSFTRRRVLKRGWARGTRIKPAMEVVSVHYPHSFGRETGTWNNKTRGRASQRFPFGPWPFVALRGPSWQFLAAVNNSRKPQQWWCVCIWLYITTTTHWLLYIWRKIRGRKKSPIFRTQRGARIRKSGEMQTVLEQFAIVRRIRRLLREEVDDKRGDVSSKEHQHQ